MNKFMELAVQEAKKGIKKGHGGPFGCVVVKDNQVISKAHNQVLEDNDPTSHGEINAIQKACKKLKTFDLTGCELYTTAEPCPMCLCACLWANVNKVFYGCTIEDTENIGFRDNKFDNLFGKRKRMKGFLIRKDRTSCLKLFEDYSNIKHKLY